MRNIITTILITLLTYSLYAQVPGIGQVPLGMKYQAVARDAQGQPMSNQTVALRFTIMQGSADGTVVFTEQQSESANDVGLFVLTIGEINNTDFSNIDWRLGDHFLKVERNDGGWVDLGTHQLLSVPYAMTAGNGKIVNPEFNDEVLRIHGSNGSGNVILGGNGANSLLNNGTILISDENDDWKVAIRSNHDADAGDFLLKGRNNNNNIVMGPVDATNADFGVLRILDDEGAQRVTAYSAPGRGGLGAIDVYGENNTLNTSIGNLGDNNHGAISLRDGAGDIKVLIGSNPNTGGRGGMDLRGENGNFNISLTHREDNNHGEIKVHNVGGGEKVTIASVPSANGAGNINILGAGNNFNVTMGSMGNNRNHGRIWVHNGNGNGVARAGLQIVEDGQGEVFADIKCFHMDHPKNTEKEIWYACIEGPEAAAYERGTAQLVDGEAQVDFSEHFELVANPETMTVILTPNSALSEGLAVIEKTATGIKVKELRNGTGNYKFDWEVKCVRKGYEDFQVIRDKKRMEEMMGIDHTQENK